MTYKNKEEAIQVFHKLMAKISRDVLEKSDFLDEFVNGGYERRIVQKSEEYVYDRVKCVVEGVC